MTTHTHGTRGWCNVMLSLLQASPNHTYLRRYARALEQQQQLSQLWLQGKVAVSGEGFKITTYSSSNIRDISHTTM